VQRTGMLPRLGTRWRSRIDQPPSNVTMRSSADGCSFSIVYKCRLRFASS
jgi:hypothetical protein